MFSRKLTRSIAGGAAAIDVAVGAYATVNSSSSTGVPSIANPAPPAQSIPNQRAVGQIPKNWRPGTGTIITGAAANKAKAAALAKTRGTVNHVLEAERRLVRRPQN